MTEKAGDRLDLALAIVGWLEFVAAVFFLT